MTNGRGNMGVQYVASGARTRQQHQTTLRWDEGYAPTIHGAPAAVTGIGWLYLHHFARREGPATTETTAETPRHATHLS